MYLIMIPLLMSRFLVLYLYLYSFGDIDFSLFFLGVKEFFDSLFSKRHSAGGATLEYLFTSKILRILLHFAFQAIAGYMLRGKYDYNTIDNIKYPLKNPPNKLNTYHDLKKVPELILLTLLAGIGFRASQKAFWGSISETAPE